MMNLIFQAILVAAVVIHVYSFSGKYIFCE